MLTALSGLDIQVGAAFVDDAAKKRSRRLLSDSNWVAYAKFDNSGIEDSIRRGLEKFDLEKKSLGARDGLKLKVVSSRLNYEADVLRIRRGELLLSQGVMSIFSLPGNILPWTRPYSQ
jgi:hypothetical protein